MNLISKVLNDMNRNAEKPTGNDDLDILEIWRRGAWQNYATIASSYNSVKCSIFLLSWQKFPRVASSSVSPLECGPDISLTP